MGSRLRRPVDRHRFLLELWLEPRELATRILQLRGRIRELPSEASYLIKHIGKHDEAQARLARVLAIFHTTPILHIADLPADLAEHVSSLTVQLRNTTADERNAIWTALGRQARLALFYTVDVALIDLLGGPEGWGRITQHRIDYVGGP
jgi:hypothetical protein